MDYESVERLPYGLVSLEIDHIQQYIVKLSPKAVWLKAHGGIRAGAALRFSFRDMADHTCHYLDIADYQVDTVQHDDHAALVRLSFFGNADYARCVRKMTAQYARYVQLRSEGPASWWGDETGAYPLERDEEFFDDIRQQRSIWYGELLKGGRLVPGDCRAETALAVDTVEMAEWYLDASPDRMMQRYAERKEIPYALIEGVRPDRLYVGNAYCARQFPDEGMLERLLEKAAGEGLPVTLVTAQLRQGETAAAESFLRRAAALPGLTEVVVNDWGMLMLASGYPDDIEPVLGTRLNPIRKDPRMKYRRLEDHQAGLLAENALGDAAYRAYLASFGVKRYEFESCGRELKVPEGKCSLHLPFYQTNTSMFCTLRAMCVSGDRGMQSPDESCGRYCERNALLYPKHLNMLGRFNSLFAMDLTVADSKAYLNRFDRLVINF